MEKEAREERSCSRSRLRGACRLRWGAGYLVAAQAVAGVHDEGLPPVVVLTHIQTLIDAEVPDLQDESREGSQDGSVRNGLVCGVGLNWTQSTRLGFSSAHGPKTPGRNSKVRC